MNLCECGCGEPAPIASQTSTRAGWIKGKPVRFKPGHNRRGSRGPLHNRWKDKVQYSSLHWWLNRNFPKAGKCEECGMGGRTEYAFLKHPEPHTRDRDDYRELCPTCHKRLDRKDR